MLATGCPVDQLAGQAVEPVLLDLPAPTSGPVGQVIHIDHYGNATTNLLGGGKQGGTIELASRTIRVLHTYGDVAPGEPLALIGSSGLVEIAVRNGSAARSLGIKVHDEVIWT
jgi:S-adenosylmethionine hydrolase